MVDINTASRDELIAVSGIGEELADAIVRARPFASVDDLISLPGIGAKSVQRLVAQGVTVSQTGDERPALDLSERRGAQMVMRDDLVERVVSAKKGIVEGSTEIWNARLDLLRTSGDLRGLLDHLISPIEPVADNGNCAGCNCGTEPMVSEGLSSVGKR